MTLLLAGLAQAAPVTIDDVCGVRDVSDAHASPDGAWVAFVVGSCSLAENRSGTDLWLVGSKAEPRALTTDPARDSSPRWSPDGRHLAFVSSRDGGPQLWVFDGLLGEPRRLTDMPGGVGEPVWTPDGRWLLFTSAAEAAEPDPLVGEDVVPHSDVLYRKGRDGRASQVWRVPLAGGAPEPLTQDRREHGEIAVSPDGRWLATVVEAAPAGEFYDIDTDVWIQPLDGPGEPRRVTANPGPDHAPVFSPDGRALLTISIREPGYESGRSRLLLWPLEGVEPTELTEGYDRPVRTAAFSPDGEAVLALVDTEGLTRLARFEVARPGEPRLLTAEGDLDMVDGRVAIAADGTHPPEVWLISGKADTLDWKRPRGARRLTDLNRGFTESREISPPRELWFPGAAGRPVQGWCTPPVGAGEGPAPLVLVIHGGPQGMTGPRFNLEHQVLAGAGYGVLTVNFTGSTGYGQAFTDAIAGNWGGAPMVDCLAGVDAVIARGWADPQRLAVTGGSYGGYLTAWIIGQTDRFKAAMVGRAVTDLLSMYGVTDEQFFPEKDIPGTPWSNPEGYRRWSPLTYADRVKTPALVVHGAEDRRVPPSQAEEYFTALLRHGVPTELILFPGEGHGFTRDPDLLTWSS